MIAKVTLGIHITRLSSLLDSGHVHVATGLLELKTLMPFCIEDRAYLVRRAPVVCFSPHRSLNEEDSEDTENIRI